jgi:RNA recognition motif-containing protein
MASERWADQEDVSSEEGSLVEEEIRPTTQSLNSHHPSAGPANEKSQYPVMTDATNYHKRNSASAPSNGGGRDSGNMSVLVENLSYTCTEKALDHFFRVDGNCNVKNLSINYNSQQKSLGTAFIELNDLVSVQYALSANGISFQGRLLRVMESRDHKGRGGGGSGLGGNRGERRDNRPERDVPLSRDDNIAWDKKQNLTRSSNTSRDISNIPSAQTSKAKDVLPPAATRPKLQLQPRTLPIDETTPVAISESIFGSGRPRDVVIAAQVFIHLYPY